MIAFLQAHTLLRAISSNPHQSESASAAEGYITDMPFKNGLIARHSPPHFAAA
jgi:hypothetical protein